MTVAVLIYTHSEYSFFWPVMVGQFAKHNIDCRIHLLTDASTPPHLFSDVIPTSWIIHTYDPLLIWTERVKKALKELDEDYVLFLHEDWIPVGPISMERLKEIASFMEENNIGFMLSYHNFGCPLNCTHTRLPDKVKQFSDTKDQAYKYQNEPHHIFQPAMYKRTTFLLYTEMCKKTKHQNEDLESLFFWSLQNCWSVQNMETQYSIRTMNSYMFPHIHALSEGKWNLTKYPTLKGLLESYGLETESRGDHPWWELDTQ